MEAGREPDPAPRLEAKNRSVHNNYLTLPVLFTMLAGHFAFVFGADDAWLVFVRDRACSTALIRVFFNRWHAGRTRVVDPGRGRRSRCRRARVLAPARRDRRAPTVTAPVAFAQIAARRSRQRCAPCHSGASAPLGIRFETREQIEARVDDIERQAVQTRAMPPGNATGITDEERRLASDAWMREPAK